MSPRKTPTVKVINLSIGDTAREFIHTPSPWARVIDWLAYHYRVLFCISAGNYCDTINIGLTQQQFAALSDGEKISATVKAISNSLTSRRLLSPAEAMNAITVEPLTPMILVMHIRNLANVSMCCHRKHCSVLPPVWALVLIAP